MILKKCNNLRIQKLLFFVLGFVPEQIHNAQNNINEYLTVSNVWIRNLEIHFFEEFWVENSGNIATFNFQA